LNPSPRQNLHWGIFRQCRQRRCQQAYLVAARRSGGKMGSRPQPSDEGQGANERFCSRFGTAASASWMSRPRECASFGRLQARGSGIVMPNWNFGRMVAVAAEARIDIAGSVRVGFCTT